MIPKGNLLFVVIARVSARAFPIRPLFEARTKALACEISREYIIRDSASIAAIAGEKDTFSREKLLSNAITICYAAVRLRGLTTIGTMRRVRASLMRREENREAKGIGAIDRHRPTRGNWTEDERIN